MEIKQEELKGGKVRLTIKPDPRFWGRFVREAEKKLGGRSLAGFRPGKAPQEVIYSHFGEETVFDEAFGLAFPVLYQEALRQTNLRPVLHPTVETLKKDLKAPLITLLLTVLGEVVLGDYGKITIKKEEPQIEDKEIDNLLEQLRRQKATFKEVKRAIEKGDLAEIDFEGFLADKPLPGGKSKNHPLIVGDGLFVKGFEEELIGLKAGEEKRFALTFPPDFKRQELAGQKVTFQVKIQGVKEICLPPLDDAFAQLFKQKDLVSLKEDLRKFLLRQKEEELSHRYQEKLIDELLAISTVEIPQELIEEETELALADIRKQAEAARTSFEAYLGRSQETESSLRQKLLPLAGRRIKAGLIIEAIGRKENISVSPQEVGVQIEAIKKINPNAQEIETLYREGSPARLRLEKMLLGQKTLNFLLNKALL